MAHDALGCHIRARSRKCARHAVDQLARNTKVTQLHLAAARHENVGWLHIPVDDPPLVQVIKPLDDASGEFHEHLLSDTSAARLDTAVDGVHASGFTEFHTNRNVGIFRLKERAVVLYNEFAATRLVHIQFTEQLAVNDRIRRGCDGLMSVEYDVPCVRRLIHCFSHAPWPPHR